MACIPTIFALISKGVEKEVVTESAQHELIELSLYEFVTIHLMDFTLAFPDCSLATETAERTI